MNRGVAGKNLLDEALKRKRRNSDTSNRGETMSTLEQVVAQLQREKFTLKVLVADQIGLVDAVRAIKRQTSKTRVVIKAPVFPVCLR